MTLTLNNLPDDLARILEERATKNETTIESEAIGILVCRLSLAANSAAATQCAHKPYSDSDLRKWQFRAKAGA